MDQSPSQVPPALPGRPLRLSPAQLDDLVAMKLREVCAGIADWKLPVTGAGVLGDLPPARYGADLQAPVN